MQLRRFSLRLMAEMETASMAPAIMTLVLVDDSDLFRRSLNRLLAAVEGIEIVGHAEDVAGACRLIDDVRPDIVVLDVQLHAGEHGIEVLNHVRHKHPTTQVVALSNLNWQVLKCTYLRAGASAYFDKSMEFVQARNWIASCARSAPDARKSERRLGS
jgi:DNA-binding NarL/FixJ family response regulator